MPRFFIDRPIVAWVIAIFILIFRGVAITQLPIAQYPTVAPPSVVISATYPGASAKTLDESVISVIEQELNGSPGLAYMESVSQANGTGSITVTFETGTNIDLAQVDVQNRLSRATPRLPAAVTQQGVKVDKSRSNVLMFVIDRKSTRLNSSHITISYDAFCLKKKKNYHKQENQDNTIHTPPPPTPPKPKQ